MELIAYPNTAPPIIDHCQLAEDELIIYERDDQISIYAKGLINSEELIGRYGADAAFERIQISPRYRLYKLGSYWKDEFLAHIGIVALITALAGVIFGFEAACYVGLTAFSVWLVAVFLNIRCAQFNEYPVLLRNIRTGLANIDTLSHLELSSGTIEGLASYKKSAQSVLDKKDWFGETLEEGIEKKWNLEESPLALAEPL